MQERNDSFEELRANLLEKANKWIATGAQPTDTVKKILKIAAEK